MREAARRGVWHGRARACVRVGLPQRAPPRPLLTRRSLPLRLRGWSRCVSSHAQAQRLRLTGSEGRRGRRRFWQLWRRGGFFSLTPERREAHTLRWSPTAASRRHAPSLPPSHAALVVAPGRGGVWLPRCAAPQKPTHQGRQTFHLGTGPLAALDKIMPTLALLLVAGAAADVKASA